MTTHPVSETDYPLTVSQVAAASGVAPSAVRFYEKHGLIRGVRTSGNQRRFGPEAACRVRVAIVAQRLGFSISEIADLLADLPTTPQERDWARVHAILTAETERRIADLHANLRLISSGEPLCAITGSNARARGPVAQVAGIEC